jgi:thioredoxin-like negative regulator of GroEL
MINTLTSITETENIIKNHQAVLIYFSHEQCNVCKVLKPKVEELIKEEFPKMEMYYADTVTCPEISGQFGVFSVPTIIIYFDGNESIRRSRNIGIGELQELIERPYKMIFE